MLRSTPANQSKNRRNAKRAEHNGRLLRVLCVFAVFRQRISVALALAVMMLSSYPALFAFIPARGSNGRILRRDLATMPFQFRLNDQTGPSQPNITDDSDPVGAVNASFQAWQSVTTANISFAPLIMTSEPSVGGSTANLVTFADTQANRDLVGTALAVTRLNFNFTSPYNTITRTDIAFSPTITFSTTLASNTFDIQSVMTHEVGHALGADHSGVIGATMFQATGRQQSHQRTLSPDDIAYASINYPRAETAGQLGSVSGTVQLNGAGLFGAHLVAFDDTGASMVGTLSNTDGTYTISGLPPGHYMLYAEPLDGPVQRTNLGGTAGSYYSAMNTSFPSAFLGSPDNPQILNVAPGQTLANTNLSITSGPQLMNIEIAGRTAGQAFTDIFATSGAFAAGPGERFNIVLGGSGLNRVSSLSQLKLCGGGVRIAAGATLNRFTFTNGLPGVGFLAEVTADAPSGRHSILATDGTAYAFFSGGFVVVSSGGSTPTTTTTLPPTTSTTTTSSTTTTTRPTTTTTTTLAATTTTSSTTTTTRVTTTTSTSTTISSTTTSSTTTTTLGPGQPYLLHFPFLYSDGNLFTGVALANTSGRTANLILTAYNSAGARLSGSGITNPATLALAPGAQTAFIADQVFHFPAGIPQKGWFEVSSDNQAVTGFYLIGDYAQQFIDGADVGSLTSTELVLAGVRQSPSAGTEISLVNPDPQRAAQATIDLYDESGRLLATMDRTINPLGRIYGSIPSLFGISVLSLGHIEVRSDRGLAGAMILGEALRLDGGPANRLAVFRAQPRPTQSQRYYIPQYVVGGGYDSHVFLANAGGSPTDVRLTFLGEDGRILSAPPPRTVGPHSSMMLLPSLFGLTEASPSLVGGYLQMEVSTGSVVGSVAFEDAAATLFLSGMNAIARGSTEAYISQVAIGVFGYFTGVACVNIDAAPAVVDVLIYDATGQLLARGTRVLQGGQRFSELLEQITGYAGPQQGGYVRILSTQPVVCFGVVGTERTLASVPAQTVGQ